MENPETKGNRKLTEIEEAFALMYLQKGYFHVVNIMRIKGEISQTILQKALDQLQSSHLLLSSRIIGTTEDLRFTTEATEAIPLLVISGNSSWQDIVKAESNRAIESNKVLLRCTLLQQLDNINYLITTVHHSISDAKSCIKLQSELLQYYQAINECRKIEIEQNPDILALEQALPDWMKGEKGIEQGKDYLLFRKILRMFYKPEQLASLETVPNEQRTCIMTHRNLEAQTTQSLVQLARENNTTIQGVLGSAMLFVVSDHIRQGNSRNINVSCRSVVDLRKHLNPPIEDNALGVVVSLLMTFHRLKSSTSFWDLSRAITKDIKLSIKRQDIFKPLKLVRQIFVQNAANPDYTAITASVSNIGKIDIPAIYGNLEIEEISFMAANGIYGRTISVFTTTFTETMFLNFVASKPSLNQEMLEQLADKVMLLLKSVSSIRK